MLYVGQYDTEARRIEEIIQDGTTTMTIRVARYETARILSSSELPTRFYVMASVENNGRRATSQIELSLNIARTVRNYVSYVLAQLENSLRETDVDPTQKAQEQ